MSTIDVMTLLSELQRMRRDGEISQTAFDDAYRALDSQVGVPCAKCGHVPAAVRDGTRVLCGGCELTRRGRR